MRCSVPHSVQFKEKQELVATMAVQKRAAASKKGNGASAAEPNKKEKENSTGKRRKGKGKGKGKGLGPLDSDDGDGDGDGDGDAAVTDGSTKVEGKGKGKGGNDPGDEDEDGTTGCICMSAMTVLVLASLIGGYASVLADDMSLSGECPPTPCPQRVAHQAKQPRCTPSVRPMHRATMLKPFGGLKLCGRCRGELHVMAVHSLANC